MAQTLPYTNITFWNGRGLNNKKETLEDYIFNHNIDICGISENKYSPNKSQTFKKYNLFHKSNMTGNGGVAILAKRGIKYKINNLQLPPNYPDTIAIEFTIHPSRKITVITIYSNPNENLTQQIMEDIINKVIIGSGSANNIIIGGDLIAHHHIWGSKNITGKGREIANFLSNYGFVLLNDGSVTRLGTQGQQHTSIDLTLISPNLAISAEWTTVKDTMGSDNLPIGDL
jgi:hypothetical protein